METSTCCRCFHWSDIRLMWTLSSFLLLVNAFYSQQWPSGTYLIQEERFRWISRTQRSSWLTSQPVTSAYNKKHGLTGKWGGAQINTCLWTVWGSTRAHISTGKASNPTVRLTVSNQASSCCESFSWCQRLVPINCLEIIKTIVDSELMQSNSNKINWHI